MSSHKDEIRGVAVVRSDGEYRIVARTFFPVGSRLFGINGELTSTPTRYSVQVGSDTHIDLPGEYTPEEIMDRFYWRFTNHSCEPNVRLDGRDFYALRAIEPWEEITFHYSTTEYEMAEPFDCYCGTASCEGRISGFRFLSAESRERLRPLLADHLQWPMDESVTVPAGAAEETCVVHR